MTAKADIGVIGGSGLYSLFDDTIGYDMDTPFGKPSDAMTIADFKGKKVAFLPRHGRNHTIPPHMINYRANLHAMKQLEVRQIIAPTASGSLKAEIEPGDFVVCDQFVDRTWGRKDTFHDGPETVHTSSANPYSPELRKLAYECGIELGMRIHPDGTVVVIQGPRFSTVAESRWFSRMGWEVINMTQYPECYLALELGIPYVNISLITDYDAGLEGRKDIQPVTHEEVLRVFKAGNDKLKRLLLLMLGRL